MTKFAAALVGIVVGIVPLLAAGVTFLDPLFRKRKDATTGAGGKPSDGAADDGFLPITTVQKRYVGNDLVSMIYAQPAADAPVNAAMDQGLTVEEADPPCSSSIV